MQVSEEKLSSIFTLLIALNGLFAKDETEHANLLATGLIKDYLGAASVALFYKNADDSYRFCLSGSPFAIGITEDSWKASLEIAERGEKIHKFGPWALPGFDTDIHHWISLRLFEGSDLTGYLLVGRNAAAWSVIESKVLEYIAEVISTIVGIRIIKNVTEDLLHEKEKRLRNLFDGSPDMIYTADAEDRITAINYAGVKLLGLQNAEQAIGKKVSSFSANPEARQFELERVIEHGYSADNETIWKHANGAAIFCIDSTTLLRNPSGETIEIQGIVKNITARIMSERELWKSTLELVDANKKLQMTQELMIQHEKLASIGQLAAGVAHEINNPLGFLKSNQTMIDTYLAKIRTTCDEAKSLNIAAVTEIYEKNRMPYVFSNLETISKESEDGFNRIIRIVTDLKSFSRIDQGTGFEFIDINAGIESTLIVGWNEIKYVAEVEKDLGVLPPVRARANEINQVILNLLVNAAQAIQGQNRAEKGTITVKTWHKTPFVRIEIHDDGPGIPEAIRSKIFEPFFTTKDPGKGTGLGLSISYNIIVSKHGGKLYAESGSERGTTFVIELPVDGPEELASL